ncbi:MAG: LpxD N-terminal domain-containing protein, partial [Aeromonas sp.]
MAFTLAQLAQQLGAEIHGDETVEIRKVATFEKAGEGEITFLSNKKYRPLLAQCKATAVLITEA